jgi:hypothetical protein
MARTSRPFTSDPSLEAPQFHAIEQLVTAAEKRLDERGHAQRVGELSAMLALKIGLPNDEVELIRHAAPMHDIGIIGVPDRILLKPGRLSGAEFAQIRLHVDIGAKMLSYGDSAVLEMAKVVARSHHERIDGSGYPNHLKGDRIPLPGQIVALADFFDTLTRSRPYRRAYSADEALGKLKRRSGRHFNPMLVTAFVRGLSESDIAQRDPNRAAQGFRLQGTVDTNTLFDLLMSVDQNGRSGRFVIYIGHTEATLYLHRGQVVEAAYGKETGEIAVAKLLLEAQRYAQMDFTLEPWTPPANVELAMRRPLKHLLLDSTVQMDELLAAV